MALGDDRSYNITDDGGELARVRLYAGIKKDDDTFDTELKELLSVAGAWIDRLLTSAGADPVPMTGTIPIEILTGEAEIAGGTWRENRFGGNQDAPRALTQPGQTDPRVIEGSIIKRRGEKRVRDYIQANYLDDPTVTNPTGIFEYVEDEPRWK